MQLGKKILIVCLQSFICVFCFAQNKKIDSLKKTLPSLDDSARVDCLNQLSENFLSSIVSRLNSAGFDIDSTKYYRDKSLNYAILAFNEAMKINYMHGIAEAISNRGEIELSADNFPAAENLFRKSLDAYRQTSNKKGLAETYANLGFVQYAQSDFSKAINNFDTAYAYYKKNNDRDGILWALFISGHIYAESGNYEKAFELDTKSLDLAIQYNDHAYQSYQLRHIAALFEQMGDYKNASYYFGKAYAGGILDSSYYLLDYAELCTRQHQYDSAKYYYGLFDTSDNRSLRFYLVSTGEYYFARKQHGKALINFLRGLDYHKQKNDRNQVMRVLLDIAKTYLALQNTAKAFEYGKLGLDLAKQTGAKQFIRDGNEILYLVYDAVHQTDSAYTYYRDYIKTKDSILNDQIKAQLIAYGPEQKLKTLNKEKEIQQARLQKEALWRKFFVSGIIALLFIAAIIVRLIMLKRKNEAHKREIAENELQIQKLESEKKEDALRQQATELQMQALRAQMNPHFIFNSLNSINRFILQNNRAQASEYLTKFSKLVRMILQNSQQPLITLESELESMRLYLDLEALRFENRFVHKISISPDIDISALKVPPLIIQPYAENAIWHGLMHKNEKGQLDIEVTEEGNHIYFRIVDDGIGRAQAATISSKSTTTHKSMGLRITADRIAMMQKSHAGEPVVTINDLINDHGSAAGTEVIIKLPVIYD